MARIRTIKPDFWTDEKIMDCDPLTRLLFIGMWNFADDYGRLPYSPKSIKALVFPGDAIDHYQVDGMLKHLSSVGLILVYSANGRDYLEVTGWQKHQKIDRPTQKHPAPFVDASTNTRRVVVEASPPDKEEEVDRKIDIRVEARASGPTERSKSLTDAFWKAQGFKSKLEITPEYAGVDWRAIEWERANWTPEMVAAEVARVGSGKPIPYYEKVFATAHAKLNAPLPVVEVKEAQTLQVHHAPARRSGSVVEAFRQLREQVRSGNGNETGGNPVLSLPSG